MATKTQLGAPFTADYSQAYSISGNIFKRRGAWFSLMCRNTEYGSAELRLITHHGGKIQAKDKEKLLDIYPTFGGNKVPFSIQAELSQLTVHTRHGQIRFTFADATLLLAEGDPGMGLKLEKQMEQHETVKPRAGGAWEGAFRCSESLIFKGLLGSGFTFGDRTWSWEKLSSGDVCGVTTPDADGRFTLAIEEFTHAGHLRPAYPGFREARESMQADWEDYNRAFAPFRADLQAKGQLARYTQWAYLLEPRGPLLHKMLLMLPTDLCSQWQLCENAVALGERMDLALELLLAPLDRAAADGQLSDVYDDVFAIRQMYKPPVHGWAVLELMKTHDLMQECPREKLEQLYDLMGRWGDWFMLNRDDDHDGLPAYEHGDETGFDDCTLFRDHISVTAPDLSAYLVLLFEAEGKLAQLLGKPEADSWLQKSQALLNRMLALLWDGEQFCGLVPGTGERLYSDSVIHFLPLVLGDRLPSKVLDTMTDRLMSDAGFLTPYGVASESIYSDYYHPAGMSMARGYILPPAMIFLCTGLLESARREEGKQLAERYCRALGEGNFPFLMNPIRGGSGFFGGTWPCCAYTILASKLSQAD